MPFFDSPLTERAGGAGDAQLIAAALAAAAKRGQDEEAPAEDDAAS